MSIKILNEDYKKISKAQLALLQYSSTLQYQYPKDIDEEKLLCVTMGLQIICNKVFSYQPSQEIVSHTIKTKLRTYFENKPKLKKSDDSSVKELNKYLTYSNLIKNFIENPSIIDITDKIKNVHNVGLIKYLQETLLDETNKKIFSSAVTQQDIEHSKVYITKKDFNNVWKQIMGSSSTLNTSMKNSFVRGKYIVLLDKNSLIKTLTSEKLYKGLASDTLRIVVSIINDTFSLFSDVDREKLYLLTNSYLFDYKKDIYKIEDFKNDVEDYNLTDLFYVTDKYKLKSALNFFINLLMKDKTEMFYIKYQVNKINDNFFINFDSLLDTSIESFHEEFNKLGNIKTYDLWQSEIFRMIWFIFTIWFRKVYDSSVKK